jgi:uncharacterized Zn finger protein (UPF0148 family)
MTELRCPNCGGKQFNEHGGLRQCAFCNSEFLIDNPALSLTRTQVKSKYGSSTSSTTTMTSSTSSTTTTFPYADEWLVVEDPTNLMVSAGLAALILTILLLAAQYFINLLGGGL